MIDWVGRNKTKQHTHKQTNKQQTLLDLRFKQDNFISPQSVCSYVK